MVRWCRSLKGVATVNGARYVVGRLACRRQRPPSESNRVSDAAVSQEDFLMSTASAMSADFNVGDLAILQHSVFHPEYDGALAQITDPEKRRGSITPAGRPRPLQSLYRVRVIAPVEGEVSFSVARYQLRPLDGVAFRRALPRAAPEQPLRPPVSRPFPGMDGQGPRAQRTRRSPV